MSNLSPRIGDVHLLLPKQLQLDAELTFSESNNRMTYLKLQGCDSLDFCTKHLTQNSHKYYIISRGLQLSAVGNLSPRIGELRYL